MSAPFLFLSSTGRQRLVGRPPAFTPPVSGASLIGEWQLAELSGSTATESQGLSNGAYQGAMEFGIGSIVSGDASTSVGLNGTDTGVLIPHVAGMALGSYSVVVYFQPTSLPADSAAQTLFTKYGATEPGAMSIELYNDGGTGRIRAYTKTAAGSTVWAGGTSTGFGTIVADTAYRVAVVVGANGMRLYLDNTELASSTNPEGWLNNSVDIRLGNRNAVVHYHGIMKRVLLYSGALSASEIAALAAAQNASNGGSSAITLQPIDAWGVDAASGGTISSASGGTLPAITVDIDPTPYLTNAVGTKADWSAEFRNSTLGTWARQASGDFRFTPGATAGVDNSEYRVSDGAGVAWSDWTPITIEVVARPPGPFFLVEDYAGDNQTKVQAAIDAANTAGGTATTLQRATVWTDVNKINPREAHMLGIMLKRKRAVHGPTGDFCGVNVGAGKCDNQEWLDGGSPGYFDRLLEHTNGASSKRLQYVLCDLDGNAEEQPVRQTQGDNPTPSDPCGTCWGAAAPTSNNRFNLQQQSIINFRGADASGAENMKTALFKRTRMRDACGDGILAAGSCDLQVYDCEFIDTFRGSWLLGSGNSVIDAQRCVCRTVTGNAPGVDVEPFPWAGTLQTTSTNTDCDLFDDLDVRMEEASDHTFTRCIVGPGVHWLGGGSSTCRHVDGEVRFHVRGGGTGGGFPREAFRAVGDGKFTVSFEDIKFAAWGDPYHYHGTTYTPAVGDAFGIEINSMTAAGKLFTLSLTNCEAASHNLPGSNTVRLLAVTVSSFTPAEGIVRLDGLTIGAEYTLDAIKLNGQKLEYRNVVHQGFPSATIQQICPGAGEYVAIGAPPPPPPPSPSGGQGAFGTVTPIADNNHPNLMWTDAEIVELRNLINAGTFSDLNAAWNRVDGKTAILIPGGWPSTYPDSARHAREANHNNLLACISYAVEPTTTKANAMRNALNDMKNRYPNGRRGDLNYGSWHHSWAWMFDLIQAYHPGHFTSQERADMKEWFRRCANTGNSIRNLYPRSSLLNNSEYNSSNYHRTDTGKTVTFYTNWYARNLCPTGAAALVSGNQTQVDFYFDSGWPHDVLSKEQITSAFPNPDADFNRFDLVMYILSHHPHGECTDTWGREHFRHPEDDFFTGTYGRYHPSTTSNVIMAAEMAYRNGMSGVWGIKDSFVSIPYLRLCHEFMYDYRDALNRSGGGSTGIPAFKFYWAGLGWSRYNAPKLNSLHTVIQNTADQRGDDGGDIPDDFGIIYKYPRRVV